MRVFGPKKLLVVGVAASVPLAEALCAVVAVVVCDWVVLALGVATR